MSGLKRAWDALLVLVYPRRAVCMGCGTRSGFPRDWLCETCRENLASRWVGAGRVPEGGLFDGAAYGYYYGGPASGLVRHLKYQSVTRLSGLMAKSMADAYAFIEPTGADGLVPVPMHRKRLRQRGFNHAELLAKDTGAILGLPVVNAVERTRNTRQQARLSGVERRNNLEGAFALAGDVRGRRLVLVDDVCTTGATANACARLLREGGAEAVYLLCFAVAGKEKGEA